MDGSNYRDLLEALNHDIATVIIAVEQNGKLIDWVPSGDYFSLQQARSENDWPEDATISLLYGLDALVLYSDPKNIRSAPSL